jgi:hypothetical protein
LPQVLWYDNNCNILRTLHGEKEWENMATTRNFFDGSLLVVDVFHFKCKHKASDHLCSQECNPIRFSDWLRTEDGMDWRFNSSAAEQGNVWYGKFSNIVREMCAVKHDFVMDEVVKRRNRVVVKELDRKGHSPYGIPRQCLV